MNSFIGLLLPSLIGYKIFLNINKKIKFNIESKVFYYLMFVLFSNTISVFISRFLLGLNNSLDDNLYAYPLFSMKYIIISIIVNIILVVILSFVKELSFSISIEKTNRGKHEKKSSK